MAENTSSFQSKLAMLRRQYIAELPTRLAAIANELDALVSHEHTSGIPELRRHVHGLSGSGATFGFQELSATCRVMESLLVQSTASGEPLDHVALMSAWGFVQQAAQAAMGERPTTSTTSPAGRVAPRVLPPPRVWVVDPTGLLDHHTLPHLTQHGFDVETFTSPVQALERAGSTPGAVLVVDAGELGDGQDGIGLAEEMRDARGVESPVIFLGGAADLNTRLRAIRAGGVAWLRPPVLSDPLIDQLDRVVERGARAPYRVLIVEDDPNQAEVCAVGLRKAGLETRVVSPAGLLASLETVVPDVVLMDLYLAGCLGSELAMIVRQDPRWAGLPIVFLSIECDEAHQHRALVRGGDAFLTKPLAPGRLAELLTARASRARVFRQQLLRDGLTGTLNHAALMGALGSEIAGAFRRGTRLAFAMFDLDAFKDVNDRYGHAVGDRVLRAFAQLLKQRLRAGDTIGRYGGEEFGIVLPDIDGPGAFALIDSLRAGFAEIEHPSDAGPFRVTVSAGIATCPEHATGPAIRDAADAALYRAKRAGRDRVELDEPQPIGAGS
ncbi:MAG: diguanylate cyclase [Myxococcota bacterium]